MIEFTSYEEAEQYCEDNGSFIECGCGCGQYSESEYEVQSGVVVCIRTSADMYAHIEKDEEIIGIIKL